MAPPTGAPFRLRSKSVAFKIENLPFPNPGRYELRILFGEAIGAKVDLFVEEVP
jgi:hypothetical protein